MSSAVDPHEPEGHDSHEPEGHDSHEPEGHDSYEPGGQPLLRPRGPEHQLGTDEEPEEGYEEETAPEADHDFGTDEQAGGHQRFDCTGDDAAALALATEAARTAVEAGECIVLPTDTVYGIGADAFSADAVQRLLDAKMRGRDMPPPVLIADASLIRALATEVPDTAKELVARHWPGPLTVICKIQPSLRMDLGETGGTIALRVPDHELTREVLRRTGPMAVSSANLSGKPAALSCDEAIDQLGDRVGVYLDGGRLTAHDGAPSTIVDFTQHEEGDVLRRGALSLDVLRESLPDLVDLTEPDADLATPASAAEPEGDDEPVGDDEPGADAEPADEVAVTEPVESTAPTESTAPAVTAQPAAAAQHGGAHALDPDALPVPADDPDDPAPRPPQAG